jgi:hypothetical protein
LSPEDKAMQEEMAKYLRMHEGARYNMPEQQQPPGIPLKQQDPTVKYRKQWT